jgi:hypothetical protein
LKRCNYLFGTNAIHTWFKRVMCKHVCSNEATLKIVYGGAVTTVR